MRLDEKRASLLKIWTAVALLMPIVTTSASTLNMEGTASYTIYKTSGAILRSFHGRFSLAVDSSKWRVKYFNDEDNTAEECTFDGEFTYTIYTNLPLGNYNGQTNVTKGENGKYYLDGNTAMVDNFRQSIPLFTSARVAWMGLITCGWISDVPSQLIPPWLERASPEAFSYRTHIYQGSVGQSNCCSTLDFITSEKLWTTPKAAKEAVLAKVPKEDFVEARFQVTSYTNYQDKCISLETEFVRFRFPKIQEKTRQSVRSVIRTKVSRYYFSSEAISRPTPLAKTYVPL